MAISKRAYNGDEDFMRVRQFLINTFGLYGGPFNWLLDEWNFCRYHVLPLHTYYNTCYFSVPTRPHRPHRDERLHWEKTIGLWHDDCGDIVGVAHSANETPGEVWLELHPQHHALAEEMLDHAEEQLADVAEGVGFVKIMINKGSELEAVVARRGYRELPQQQSSYLEYRLEQLATPRFPPGFTLKSVAEEDDVEQRRRVKALAFGGRYAPSEWPPASAFHEMQKAPDYRSDLDLFVKAPNGDYAAFCTIWLDEKNRYANVEPLGTHPEYQRQGLASELLKTVCRCMAERGALRSFMRSSHRFYRQFGFQQTCWHHVPWIRYFRASEEMDAVTDRPWFTANRHRCWGSVFI